MGPGNPMKRIPRHDSIDQSSFESTYMYMSTLRHVPPTNGNINVSKCLTDSATIITERPLTLIRQSALLD